MVSKAMLNDVAQSRYADNNPQLSERFLSEIGLQSASMVLR
ncbi:hypothetical protein RR45_GL002112 [Lactococcus chungangensis CAU 28 = DSM 22330]|uniref:Uncharacterized protein n=1 Tax=Pseudolactococcus chungangensis CAU 28 = DSM 22330 TaxID=1122154 RepID=A0ABX4I8J6_9LACT|nr:hypothetical protein RR45_GL002112 [Lactococcus chungangensis CAU 28 = DSM 22330]